MGPSARAGGVATGRYMSDHVFVPLSTLSGEQLVSHAKPRKIE